MCLFYYFIILLFYNIFYHALICFPFYYFFRRDLLGRFTDYNKNKRLSDAQVEAEYQAYKLANKDTFKVLGDEKPTVVEKIMVASPKPIVRSSFRKKKSLPEIPITKKTSDSNSSNETSTDLVTSNSRPGTSNTNTNINEDNSSSSALISSADQQAVDEIKVKNRLRAAIGKSKKKTFQYKAYKYPEDINVNPMDWLMKDVDYI